MLRGHLEITGITTVAELAAVDHAHRTARRWPGSPTSSRAASRSRAATPTQAVDTEWVSRRLLARMHSYSRRTRRAGVEPATAQDFMRFLLRWQHVAPGTQLAGEAGLLTVVEQLQGFDAAAVAWEPDLLGSRLRRYDAAWLDRLCHDGEVAWLRINAAGAATIDAPAVAPSKATPISLVSRADLAVAARRGARWAPTPASRWWAARPRSSRCCASAARASPPSWARRPTASPKTSSARCGTASPAAW